MAEEYDTGELGDGETELSVVSFKGTSVPGATIHLEQTAQETVTDESGHFLLQDVVLGPGYNRLTVTASDLVGSESSVELLLYRTPDECVGPDQSGMRGCVVLPSFTDISTTGQVILADADDDTQPIPVSFLGGFDFAFYGVTQDTFIPSTNGLVTFSFGIHPTTTAT